MSLVDPISDVLTKIRNASSSKHDAVDVRASKFAGNVLDLLKKEGFIRNYQPAGEAPRKTFRVYLKYSADRAKVPAISSVTRVSRPGLRQYRRSTAIPRVLNGLGVGILTTPKGVMTDQEARRQKVGGEVLCYVW